MKISFCLSAVVYYVVVVMVIICDMASLRPLLTTVLSHTEHRVACAPIVPISERLIILFSGSL